MRFIDAIIYLEPMDGGPRNLNATPDRKQNNFMSTLPKANDLFETGQHLKRNIYPFQMKSMGQTQQDAEQANYHKQTDVSYKPKRETVMMHFETQDLVYDKFNNNADEQLFNLNLFPLQRLRNLKNNDYITSVELTQPFTNLVPPYLSFDSRFESGNLALAAYVDETYCLLLHNDVNTFGYTSWFYFQVRNRLKGRQRFAIMNYGKAGWVHNNGVKICLYTPQAGWTRGGENICCLSNQTLFSKGKFLTFNTLYFQYDFQSECSEVYFAYNVPYTYNDLCCLLDGISSPYFHRKITGLSLAGNRLEMLTVTNFQIQRQGVELPAIVVMARTHPGETVSSWVMHYFLQFLLSDAPQAELLRDNFVFKLFPMLNPDGVIHGNYRCSLSGRDLNRRWLEPNKDLFPEAFFTKNQILELSKRKNIKMILDLHGHTQRKKVFAYGCNDKNEPHRSRLYPYILSKLTSFFDFKSCNFCIDKSKAGTARVSLFNQLKVPYTYTIETSQFGTTEGHLSSEVFKEVGQSLAKGILLLFKIKKTTKLLKQGQVEQQQEITEGQSLQRELQNDATLLKIGMEKDDGSDSEPSADNIKFDRLAELNQRKGMKINTNIVRTNKDRNYSQNSGILHKINEKAPVRPKTGYPRGRGSVESSTPIWKPSLTNRNAHLTKRSLNSSIDRNNCDLSTDSRQKQRTSSLVRKPDVNFINLSLSINEEGRKPYVAIPLNLRFENRELYNKLRVISRNFTHFRKLK